MSEAKTRKTCGSDVPNTGLLQERYSSHGHRKQVTGDHEANKPPLSSTSNYKRGSLSNTPVMKLEGSELRKKDKFNNTVKNDNVSTNL
jgi:hypothetical protein